MVVLEPRTQVFIENLAAGGSKTNSPFSVEQARRNFDAIQNVPGQKLPADVQDLELHVGPTGTVPIRIYRPHGAASGVLPVVMYFHGGGWITGSRETHDRLMRGLVNATANHGTKVAFVFVDYTLSPEAVFPVPVEQAYSATKYVAEHGRSLLLDGSRIAVAGDSVGGNMAASVAILAKERGGPKLLYQALFTPVTDASMSEPSYTEFEDGPWLTRAAMARSWNLYAPDKTARRSPEASPLAATVDQVKGLPPTLIITDENDVARDEGEAYARKLISAGVTVTSMRFLATIHNFIVINALVDTPAAKQAMEIISGKLAAVLADPER